MFVVTVDESEWKALPKERKDEVRSLKARLSRDPFAAGDRYAGR